MSHWQGNQRVLLSESFTKPHCTETTLSQSILPTVHLILSLSSAFSSFTLPFFFAGGRHQRADADQLHVVQRRVGGVSRPAGQLQAVAVGHRREDDAAREAGPRLLLDR